MLAQGPVWEQGRPIPAVAGGCPAARTLLGSNATPMTIPTTAFDAVERALDSDGVEGALAQLTSELRSAGSYHELFDALLMQARRRLKLPLLSSTPIDELPADVRDPLEQAYLEACREAGTLLLDQGRIREAWMYLRPVGDKQAVAQALRRIEPTDEQVEPLIEVALHEGVDPELGFQLMLDRYGTCNSISMFDNLTGRLPKTALERLAARLVRHLHRDLLANVRADIERRGGEQSQPAQGAAEEGSHPRGLERVELMADLLDGRDWLFADDNYHIDTSHLSAVVRAARLVNDPQVLALAADLTEYGRRLSKSYQYAGEAPFEDLYGASRMFFRAQLGEEIEAAVDFFDRRASETDAATQGTGPAEVYVALLARLGRQHEAIRASIELLPPGAATSGFAPSLIELSRAAADYGPLVEQSRRQGNLLTFTAGLLERSSKE